MQYKINEIYVTRQGEGFWSGRKVVLVRLAGCNLRCPWCDTKHDTFEERTPKELFDDIMLAGNGCRSVLITGGEPLLQDLEPLLKLLKKDGFWVALETNGTIDQDSMKLKRYIDHVAVSPKSFDTRAKIVAGFPNEIRIVNDGTWTVDEICLFRVKFLWTKHCYLSPLTTPTPEGDWTFNWRETIVLLSAVNEAGGGGIAWRLSPQVHKLAGLR